MKTMDGVRLIAVSFSTFALFAIPLHAAGSSREEPAAEATPVATSTPPATSATSTPARPPAVAAPSPVLTESPGGLSDVVKKSREERQAKGKKKARSLGVITNENLKKPGAGTAAEATPKATGVGTLTILPPGSMPTGAGQARISVPHDLKGRTEEDWRQMLATNRSRQERAEAEMKQLEIESKRLENDFYAWSDGNYRERVIRPNWDKAREDLKRARADLDAAAAARSDLEEDARKSGTPPGWLRDR